MSPLETVRTFLKAFSTGSRESITAMREWLSTDCVWDNTGLPSVHGLDQCIDLLEVWANRLGVAAHRIDILRIAQDGNFVLTQRIDNFYRSDGSSIMACPLMGIFQVRGGKIVSWSDYFDAQAFVTAFGFSYDADSKQ